MTGGALIVRGVALGVGLAMDAFSVSVTNGLNEPYMKRKMMAIVAGVYAFFQFLMPMIGWFCVHSILETFQAFEVAIPWIALILLLYIGGKMLMEGIRNRGNGQNVPSNKSTLSAMTLILQGIATSIDALSVGFAFASYSWKEALFCAIIIAVVTFVICLIGVNIGKRIGTRLTGKAEILGGTILILIGIEIFVRGVFF